MLSCLGLALRAPPTAVDTDRAGGADAVVSHVGIAPPTSGKVLSRKVRSDSAKSSAEVDETAVNLRR